MPLRDVKYNAQAFRDTIHAMSVLSAECEKKEWILPLIEAGCDELIFAYSQGTCGALRGFDLPELRECIAEAHARGAKAVISAGRLFHENEMQFIDEVLSLLDEADGLLFADPAFIYRAQQKEKLIYDPLTLNTGSSDMNAWLSLGIGGAVISPLLTIQETMHVLAHCAQCTVPVHGYMKMSVSQRKLLSAYDVSWKYRSDLRLQEEKRDGTMPVFEDDYGTVIYTDEKLQSLKYIKEFEEAGAQRLMICSAYLDQNEICSTVRAYRSVLHGTDPLSALQSLQEEYGSTFGEGYYEQPTIL